MRERVAIDLAAFGAVALGLASSLGAWFEVAALILTLRRRLPTLAWPIDRLLRLAGWALLPLPAVGPLWWLLQAQPVALTAAVVLGFYGLVYMGATWACHVEELGFWLDHPRLRRGRG